MKAAGFSPPFLDLFSLEWTASVLSGRYGE
jgi:hypothetical protein